MVKDKNQSMDLKKNLTVWLEEKTNEHGLGHFGMSELSMPMTMDFYESWLNKNFHADMSYLSQHAEIKKNPQLKYPLMRSALVFSAPYFPHPHPLNENSNLTHGLRTSLYSQGEDYHHWFQSKMNLIISELQEIYPEESFLACTDSSPILERDLAYRAGLGWFGKNTCLIHPKKGSLFFIGEILTSLKLETTFDPLPDFCGTCTRCIEVCPTSALDNNKNLNSNLCISYWNIESKGVPPEHLRSKMSDWFFGCDLCQTVCPWNQKNFKGQLSFQSAPLTNLEQTKETLREILTSSHKKLQKKFMGTAYSRTPAWGLKRNAIIVATNLKIKDLLPEILALQENEKLTELCLWSEKLLT